MNKIIKNKFIALLSLFIIIVFFSGCKNKNNLNINNTNQEENSNPFTVKNNRMVEDKIETEKHKSDEVKQIYNCNNMDCIITNFKQCKISVFKWDDESNDKNKISTSVMILGSDNTNCNVIISKSPFETSMNCVINKKSLDENMFNKITGDTTQNKDLINENCIIEKFNANKK